MKAKNVISFLLVVVIIVACAYVAAFDGLIGEKEAIAIVNKARDTDPECAKKILIKVLALICFGQHTLLPADPM